MWARFFKAAFGWEGLAFAGAFAVLGMGILVGQLINARTIGRFGVLATTKAAAILLFLICGLMALLTGLNGLSPIGFALLMFLFNCCFLSVMANAASLTLDPHPEIAGLASSLFGFMTQLLPAALTLATLSLIGGEITRWAAIAAVLTGAIAIALLWYAGRQHSK